MAAFELSKWYLDCVTDQGDVSIAYTGAVNWGPIGLRYSNFLESTAEIITAKHSLRRQAEPKIDDGSLRWRSGALQIEGEWQARSHEIDETIFATDAGYVRWHCLMPHACARLHHRRGFGYAEHLNMTIAPWRLPIRTLRWGRFAAASDSVVWIDWLGGFTRRLVYRNGRMAQSSLLEDGRIEFPDGARLSMDRSLVLREGPLGTTALSAIPGIRDTFPARLLKVNECKWRSRARFVRPGMAAVEGWAIHERVDWPK